MPDKPVSWEDNYGNSVTPPPDQALWEATIRATIASAIPRPTSYSVPLVKRDRGEWWVGDVVCLGRSLPLGNLALPDSAFPQSDPALQRAIAQALKKAGLSVADP